MLLLFLISAYKLLNVQLNLKYSTSFVIAFVTVMIRRLWVQFLAVLCHVITRKVVRTRLPLYSHSIIWCWPKGSGAIWLER